MPNRRVAKQTWRILVAIENAGDMALEDIAGLIPRKWGDHRDFFPFASLVSQGLIEPPFLHRENLLQDRDENIQLLARKYFAWSTADAKAAYGVHTWVVAGDGETLKGQRFALSGSGYLRVHEIRTKRFDRAFTVATSILVGIVVGVCIAMFKAKASLAP